MKNKIIGYILITPFMTVLFFFFIIFPFMALTNRFFGWFSEPSNEIFVFAGTIILAFEITGLTLWFTNLGFNLIDKEEKK